jgi:hypothetical protein
MNRRRHPLAIAALACVGLLAGCGGSSSNSTGTAASAPGAGPTSSTLTSTAAVPAGSPQLKATILECKQIIQAQSKLPSGAKAKLEGACEKAAKGDTAAVKKAAREVCEEVIGKSAVPAGAAREAALGACRK